MSPHLAVQFQNLIWFEFVARNLTTANFKCPKSTKSRNSDVSSSRGTISKFDLIWICSEGFEFLDLVDFESVTFSVECVIVNWVRDDFWVARWLLRIFASARASRRLAAMGAVANFPKISNIVTLYSQSSGELTFANFCQCSGPPTAGSYGLRCSSLALRRSFTKTPMMRSALRGFRAWRLWRGARTRLLRWCSWSRTSTRAAMRYR